MIGREDEVREFRQRVWAFQFVLLLCFSVLIARLAYLQILKGSALRMFSESNRLKNEKLLPTRGIIFDRNGKVIVDNRAAFDVVALTQFLKNDPENMQRLASTLNYNKAEMAKRLEKIGRVRSYVPLLLKSDVSKDIIAAVETANPLFEGVDIDSIVQRRYPFKDLAAQLLGHISEVDSRDLQQDSKKLIQSGDYIGRMGLERYYDSELRGVNGIGYVEVDSRGRRKKIEGAEKLFGFVAQTEPVPGNNLYLTLDVDLEVAAAEALKSRNFNGSVVAIDPRSGEVLALVNAPSFDPEKISAREIDSKTWANLRDNKDRPLRNRAIQDIYPPGSTFKVFMAMAAMAEGKASRKTSHHCSGSMAFGNRRFSCWKAHGPTDFVKSIRESCDVFFYNIGISLGPDLIAKYARLFGLGQPTEIKMAGEQRGLIPDVQWKQDRFHDIWHPGETLSIAIGQGYVSATPIQLANAYAAIGNGGFLYKPYLVKKIEKRNGEMIKEFHPELKRKIEIPQEVFDAVKEGLYQVANAPGGTAIVSGHSKKVAISGKTGTAQVRSFTDIMKKKCEAMPIKDRHHGWFVGYAPRENPEIAVAVIAEHACHGTAAAPIARAVIEAYFDKLQPPESLENNIPNPVEGTQLKTKLSAPLKGVEEIDGEGGDAGPIE
ncbi:MAG: penicillin-binding protein 2 [Proteobacteria bacterium]|nr:penicillin-binding protein 2 [Pseudomonadota bacterium]